MAAPSSGSIIRVPGRLIWGVTNLGIPEPYGGTYLGTTRDQEFIPSPILRPIFNQVWGSYSDVIYCGEKVLLKAVVRYMDADMLLTAMFKSVSTGSSGTGFRFRPGGTTANTRAGTKLSGSSGKLMLAARAPNSHPSIIIYNAVPAMDEAAKLQFSLGEEFGLAVAFYGTPDSSGRVYDVNRLNNLVL